MGDITFRRLLVAIMMLLMLFLIVLNANIALPPSLTSSLVLTNLLSIPDHKHEIMFDIECFWFWAPMCLKFRSYKFYPKPQHNSYNCCIHQVKNMCRTDHS
jgi:hypothetical protein